MLCQYCQAERPPGVRFCSMCGGDFNIAPPASSRAERRHLTVMFCDLSGSTAMSLRIDPEELHELILGCQQRFASAIDAFGGVVERYMGDGLLAYFGFPAAHEDDAERAVHAAVRIVHQSRARRGDEHHMPVRVGIATGLVVVGDLVGQGHASEFPAIGEAPNLAKRLEEMADPDSVLIAESTRLLCGDRFEWLDRGAQVLKGFERPMRCWQVLEVAASPSRFRSRGAQALSPLIGRDAELNRLEAHWQRARRSLGSVVVIEGNAGIGKSRLAESLIAGLADEAGECIRCQCSPYHEHTPLHPFRQELERSAALGLDDSVPTRARKLQSLLQARRAEDDDIFVPLAALLSLLPPGEDPSIGMPPQQLRQKTLRAWLEMIERQSASRPTLILVEDVHWMDPSSKELLQLLAEEIASLPIMLAATTRDASVAGWLRAPAVDELRLARLSDADAALLVAAQAGGDVLGTGRVDEVVARTDGVPLFIEEFVRAMVVPGEAPSVDAAHVPLVPESLQDSLMARLDRMGAGKDVAQVASVIGRGFTEELLAAVLPLGEERLREELGALCDSSVLVPPHEDSHGEYLFQHALLRDAAYVSLLRSRRRELHAGVAAALTRLYPRLAEVQPELLAHHFANGAQPFQAARFLGLAALRALDRSANLECLAHATRALEELATVADMPGRALLEAKLCMLRGAALRAVRSFASSEAEACFQRALALGETLGDDALLIDVHRGLFSVHYARGELAEARLHGGQVSALAERKEDRASLMLAWWMLGCMAFWQGHFVEAQADLARAVALYDPAEQKTKTLAVQIDPGVNAKCHLGWAQWLLGRPDTAIATGDEAIAQARALAQPFAIAMTLFFACATRACCGLFEDSAPLLDELKALTHEHGLSYLGASARVLDGQALIAADRCAEGIAQVDLAMAQFRAQEAGLGIPWSMSIAAAGWLRLGRIEEGLRSLDTALAAMERNGERQWEAELWRLRSEFLARRGNDGDGFESAECLQRALEASRRQSALSLELRAASTRARLARECGSEVAVSREYLVATLRRFDEGRHTVDLREARQWLEATE